MDLESIISLIITVWQNWSTIIFVLAAIGTGVFGWMHRPIKTATCFLTLISTAVVTGV